MNHAALNDSSHFQPDAVRTHHNAVRLLGRRLGRGLWRFRLGSHGSASAQCQDVARGQTCASLDLLLTECWHNACKPCLEVMFVSREEAGRRMYVHTQQSQKAHRKMACLLSSACLLSAQVTLEAAGCQVKQRA